MRPYYTLTSINDITIVGTPVSTPEVVSSYQDTTLYSVFVSTLRSSNILDTVEVIVREDMLELVSENKQKLICGEIRTKNEYDGQKKRNKLKIYVFAKQILDVNESGEYDLNIAIIDGYLCKPPAYRRTANNRSMCDLLIAVNGRCGKSYYLPAVAFNEFAEHLATMSVGDRVVVSGRLQSREYVQNNNTYTVFELFICGIRGFNDVEQ